MNSRLHEYHMNTLSVSGVFLACGNRNLQSHANPEQLASHSCTWQKQGILIGIQSTKIHWRKGQDAR